MNAIIEWVVGTVGQWGYPGIVVMMFLESSCFPFPSEVVMIPAGYLSSPNYAHSAGAVPGHAMNVWAVIFMGIVGSWLGALFNYYLALLLGRPLLLKWGKYFLISEEKFEKAERFFGRHGEIGTFTARLIPVVRQYVSLPAGIVRMNLARFLLYTGLGAGIWVSVLVWIGYIAGQSEALWRPYLKTATVAALVFCALVVGVYVAVRRRGRRAEAGEPPRPAADR
jgi:membrane protein DedA with SNARE-associated domain